MAEGRVGAKKRKAALSGGLPVRATASHSKSEEGCRSALSRTTIHFGHHLLFYKDGGFGAGHACVESSITQEYSVVNGTIWHSSNR
jgi:hypothetical protein